MPVVRLDPSFANFADATQHAVHRGNRGVVEVFSDQSRVDKQAAIDKSLSMSGAQQLFVLRRVQRSRRRAVCFDCLANALSLHLASCAAETLHDAYRIARMLVARRGRRSFPRSPLPRRQIQMIRTLAGTRPQKCIDFSLDVNHLLGLHEFALKGNFPFGKRSRFRRLRRSRSTFAPAIALSAHNIFSHCMNRLARARDVNTPSRAPRARSARC